MTYFSNHPGYQKETIGSLDSGAYKKINNEIGHLFTKKDISILEIGFGTGKFTSFCNKKNIKKYIGLDIDDLFKSELSKKFTKYVFIKKAFQDFMQDKKDVYDIIYTAHIFEHLDDKERKEMIQEINKSLKKGGVWINYMPNASSILQSTHLRYADITHKIIYTGNSFSQLLNEYGLFSSIEHKNSHIGNIWWKRIVYKCFLFCTKIIYLGLGYGFPMVSTPEIISIIKK